MADAGARRYDAEIVEGCLTPFQKSVTFAIALIFFRHIEPEGLLAAEEVDHHRVIDDEIDGGERIDFLRIAAEALHRIAHRGQIDDGWNAGKILHEHAGRPEGDFKLGLAAVYEPLGHALDMLAGDRTPILIPQQVFQQHLE